MSVTAAVSHISRGSLHDGPGVRTVVYLKGCNLRCRWCHNPETFSTRPEIFYAPFKCVHCGSCVTLCPHHRIEGDEMVIDRTACLHCGRCAEICPSGALSVSGTVMSADEVMAEILKDKHYYEISGGGVTLSGGECLLQADFAAELLKRCKEAGIHTAVETALFVPWENIEKVIPFTDLFLADLKHHDPEKHRTYTGQDNRQILSNLKRLTETVPKRVLLRTPLIPGVNDAAADMAAFGAVIRPFAAGLQGVELLKYNPLGESKYRNLDRPFEAFGQSPQDNETMERRCNELTAALNGTLSVMFKR